MKTCNKCLIDKDESDYTRYSSRGKILFRLTCNECINVKRRTQYQNDIEYRLRDMERCKQYRDSNLDYKSKKRAEYERNKFDYVSRAEGRRHKIKEQRPAWADLKQIALAYEACDLLNQVTGEWHEVDHIVPLKGKLVSGLHVENNLQILTRYENRVKSNNYSPNTIWIAASLLKPRRSKNV